MWRWRERRFEENERGMRSEAITDKSDIKGGVTAEERKKSRLEKRTKCCRHGEERRGDREQNLLICDGGKRI